MFHCLCCSAAAPAAVLLLLPCAPHSHTHAPHTLLLVVAPTQQAESDMAKVGEGVTKEAQGVFDSLSRTLPCVWSGKAILVMESVLVMPPYTVDAVSAVGGGDNAALERIKRVLAAERQRLGLSVSG